MTCYSQSDPRTGVIPSLSSFLTPVMVLISNGLERGAGVRPDNRALRNTVSCFLQFSEAAQLTVRRNSNRSQTYRSLIAYKCQSGFFHCHNENRINESYHSL